MRASLVYKFSCAQCAATYIGSTGRILRTRVAEHAGRSYRTVVRLAHHPHSAVREHAEGCDVCVVLDNFSILNSTSSLLDLRILESLYIFIHKPRLNNTQSCFPLEIVNSWWLNRFFVIPLFIALFLLDLLIPYVLNFEFIKISMISHCRFILADDGTFSPKCSFFKQCQELL